MEVDVLRGLDLLLVLSLYFTKLIEAITYTFVTCV